MKRHIFYFLAIISIMTGCSKKSSDPQPITPLPTIIPTTITINVKDEIGNPLGNSNIKLYTTESDFINDPEPINYPNVTDANGTYTTVALPITYFWRIKNGCQNNLFKANRSAAPLTANQNNIFTAVLGKTASIFLTSTSSNPYYIYLDGVLNSIMNGGASMSIIVPIGTHPVRVLQKSGYLLYPTDETFNATVGCNVNYSITFP